MGLACCRAFRARLVATPCCSTGRPALRPRPRFPQGRRRHFHSRLNDPDDRIAFLARAGRGVDARRAGVRATIAAVMMLALALGYVTLRSKMDARCFSSGRSANLFFTCMAEEAFFRGFAAARARAPGSNRQSGCRRGDRRAVLFGLVHLGGGWKYASPRPSRAWDTGGPITARSGSKRPWPCTSASTPRTSCSSPIPRWLRRHPEGGRTRGPSPFASKR